MKIISSPPTSWAAFLALLLITASCPAQDCVLKDTLFNIDFGTQDRVQTFNLNALNRYQRSNNSCPDDGFYSYTSYTHNCFNGDWLNIEEDHTPGDKAGRMFLVNAAEQAGDFFIATLAGFTEGDYEFGVFMMNVCKINGGCAPLPPNINITLETPAAVQIIAFNTGLLSQTSTPFWKRYFGFFHIPAGLTTIILRMKNMTNGGCGNDFAMDDITVRRCYREETFIARTLPKNESMPGVKKASVKAADAPVKIDRPEKTIKPDSTPVVSDDRQKRTVEPVLMKRSSAFSTTPPAPLTTRKNPVIKEIVTDPGEIVIELYDNGVIDGDTVSVYHNNALVVAHKGLSANAIRFSIMINENQPYHEIVMVADNLGSIPPNTSLMVVTANKVRHEIFISSSNESNAKIVFTTK